MPVSETELEQLEAYLDGELPAGEEDALRARIESDGALSAEVEALSAERVVREAAFRSFEPSEAVARRLVMRVENQLDREKVWTGRLSKLRIASAAAACIVVGFIVGWVGRGTGGGSDTNLFVSNGASTPVVSTQTPQNTGGPTVVSFPIRDQYGNVLGFQRFDSQQRANE